MDSTEAMNREYEVISNYSSQSLVGLFYFNHFMKGLVKNGGMLYQGSKEALEMISDVEQQHLLKQGEHDQLSSYLNCFYQEQLGFFGLIDKAMNKLTAEIVVPMDSYHQNMSSLYNDGLCTLKKSINQINNQKEKLTKAKLEYYNQYQNVEKMESETLKVFSGKFFESNRNSAHEKLLIQRSQMENKSLIYKQEVNSLNQLYEMHSETYKGIIEAMADASKSKSLLMKTLIEKFNRIVNELFVAGTATSQRVTAIFNAYHTDNDKAFFERKLKDNIAVNAVKEQFVSFDIYKKSKEKAENEKRDNLMKSIELFSPLDKFIQAGENLMSYVDQDYLNDNTISSSIKTPFEKDKVKTIEQFITNVFSSKAVDPDLLDDLLQLSDQWSDFSQTFIELYFKSKNPKDFFKLLNVSNFTHLTNVFNNIISNMGSTKNQKTLELINSIILIGEKTFCENAFLCALLSKNGFFTQKDNWLAIIEDKLLALLNSKSSSMMIEEKKNRPFYLPKIAKFLMNNEEDFNGKRLEALGLDKRINKYKDLTMKQKEVLNHSIEGELHLTLKRVIPHLCNYRFNMKEAIDLILELSKKYQISEEKMNYYIIYLNTSNCSIVKKLALPKISLSSSDTTVVSEKNHIDSLTGSIICVNDNKITEIKTHQTEMIKLKYSCQIKSHKDIIKLLAFCFKYLPQEDFLSLMLINKPIGSKLKIKIHRYVLKKSDTLPRKTHMKIWSSILHVYSLRKEYPYKTSLQYANSAQKKKNDIIDLDVRRTFFKKNSEQGREAITRILRTFVFLRPKISYCQGMNYIASFLYQVVQDEETAFYLVLGLFTHTDFYMIFLEDLKKLKVFFYVFDRLILLYLPQIYFYFISQTLSVNFFASPWFITLFTNAYPSIDDDTKPNVLIKIWDLFLLRGWRGLMAAVLALIKFNADDILTCQNDELLQFMINHLVKSALFHNSNYAVFNRIIESIHIPRLLVSNLEEEIDIEQGIENVQISAIIEKAHQV